MHRFPHYAPFIGAFLLVITALWIAGSVLIAAAERSIVRPSICAAYPVYADCSAAVAGGW